MYSMVLMMALTTGAEAPAWGSSCCGWSSCCGTSSCCGGSSCCGYTSCCGGCCSSSCCGYSSCCGHSSCCGGGHKLFGFFHHSSCCGGCCGGTVIYSSCCGGCCGGSSCCGGCCGGTVVAPAPAPTPAPTKVIEEPKKEKMETVPPPPAPEKKEEKKEGAMVPTPATIVVSLPADAKLLIDDAATVSTSASRRFVTPELEAGKVFTYTLKASVVRDGKTVVASKVVTVRAGETSNIEIEVPATSVAAK